MAYLGKTFSGGKKLSKSVSGYLRQKKTASFEVNGLAISG